MVQDIIESVFFCLRLSVIVCFFTLLAHLGLLYWLLLCWLGFVLFGFYAYKFL